MPTHITRSALTFLREGVEPTPGHWSFVTACEGGFFWAGVYPAGVQHFRDSGLKALREVDCAACLVLADMALATGRFESRFDVVPASPKSTDPG